MMFQLSFLDDSQRIVNVASVPQRSPFRYPGGKTWLIPRVRQWLQSFPRRPAELIEPFAGGAIVSLTAAAENLVDHVTMVELDPGVAAVWETIIDDDGGGEWLAERIVGFPMTEEEVRDVLARDNLSTRESAFQTILRNRVNHGGIMAPGAGLIKNGEAGRGLSSRWYPETLRKRILDIAQIRDRFTFIFADGIPVIRDLSSRSDAVFFIDPPYTASKKRAGSRLYTHPDVDHPLLFSLVTEVAGDFLITYDDAEEVRALAVTHKLDMQTIAMKSTHHAKMTELLIGRDLNWMRWHEPGTDH